MSEKYSYKPPADANEWLCLKCGCDALWCGCDAQRAVPPSLPSEDIIAMTDVPGMARRASNIADALDAAFQRQEWETPEAAKSGFVAIIEAGLRETHADLISKLDFVQAENIRLQAEVDRLMDDLYVKGERYRSYDDEL